jgi:hypothetical protein
MQTYYYWYWHSSRGEKNISGQHYVINNGRVLQPTPPALKSVGSREATLTYEWFEGITYYSGGKMQVNWFNVS